MSKRLYMADGLRVLSIGLIMAFHFWQQSWLWPTFTVFGITICLNDLVATGYLFVDVMLLISGFLLYMPVARSGKLDIKSFYIKRLIRIVPCYLLCLAICLIFALKEGVYYTKADMWKDIIAHLTFTHTFSYSTYIGTGLNAALWTLAIEMQFYLIFPFVALIFKKKPIFTFLGMTAAAHIVRYYVVPGLEPINLYINQLPTMLDVYANGMMAAYVLSRIEKREFTKEQKFLFMIIVLFGFFGMWSAIKQHALLRYDGDFIMNTSQMAARWRMTFSASLILVFGECSFLFIRRIFSNVVTKYLCTVSFNVYMYHQFMAVKLKQYRIPSYEALENPNMAGEFSWQVRYTIVCFIAPIILSTVIYFAFERPITRLLQKFILPNLKPAYIIKPIPEPITETNESGGDTE